MSSTYHEPYEVLSPDARDVHRALASLIEELEAVDWYHQRADVTDNADLQAIILHNRDEEIEHAAMALEWLRRRLPKFDEELRTYLFTTGPITELEEEAMSGEADTAKPMTEAPTGDLGIGKFEKGS